MDNYRVSVIIPTYNGKEYLGETIQSVIDQTYPACEIIVVDDASPDDISPIVKSFSDIRIRYIRHVKNKGAVIARKTGVHASTGDLIAFLDQDDLFHKQKLETHVNYFLNHPQTGLTYNDRFEIQGTDQVLCGIYRLSPDLHLKDWILGFPISPSDIVLKREWALLDAIYDHEFDSQAEHVIFNGGEIVFGGRLALAGCKFGSVGRALNYRRYHPYRIQKYLTERCQSELACQEIIFSDPQCPEEVRSLRNMASSNIYVIWAYIAYIQEDFDLGKMFLRQAIELHPKFFMEGDPCQFLNSWLFWISAGTVDYVRSHEEILRSVFENLPAELQFLLKKYDWTIAQSYLLKGLHTTVWGKKEDAEMYLRKGFEKGAVLNDPARNMLSSELLNYGAELGSEAAQKVVDQLADLLMNLNRGDVLKSLVGSYALNQAFQNYQAGKFEIVPGDVTRAVKTDLRHLLNRGALSILFHSLYYRMKL